MKRIFTTSMFVVAALLAGTLTAEDFKDDVLPDAEMIRILLEQDLGQRRFAFASVIKAATGKRVLRLDPSMDAHARVEKVVREAVAASIEELNREDSPVRGLRRINEASRFFEDRIRVYIDDVGGIRCEVPTNAEGRQQRVGYPDLRIVHEASNQVFYLDPKLVEQGAISSTLRTFYFEPRRKSGKILDDAVHLLVGIEHDGKDGAWTFKGYRLVDLSTTTLRLKAEFQASNADLYQEAPLSEPDRREHPKEAP